MKSKISYMLTALFLFLISSNSFTQGNSKSLFYKMFVKINPSSGMLECEAEIRNPPDSCFILNKDMEIQSITADGKPIQYHMNSSNMMPNVAEIVIESAIPDNFTIKYSGKINGEAFPRILNIVNMIKPELVELAMYVTWYPRFKNGSISYELTAVLPSDYVTITNGNLNAQATRNNRNITKWVSYSPGFDIALLAAPDLKKTEASSDEADVEIYYDKVPETYVDSMKNDLLKSMEQITGLLGSCNTRLIRTAYSPRPAWGYVRTPFIIVSEGNALSGRDQRYGYARDFRYLTHEMAHYWWSLADMSTPEDWINEGLADYTSLLISEKIIGRDFTEKLLSECKERAANSKTETAIIETDGNSPDREVNRYDKPVLLFNELRLKYGEERLNEFLRSLYKRFKETKVVNTAAFLDELEKQLGSGAKEFFREALYRKIWNTAPGSPESSYSYADSDSLFLGTWTGTLTQMGVNYRVVLHLTVKNGILNAVLDSPDQNAKDIPVSEAQIVNNSLSFKLKAAGLNFTGVLNRDTMKIAGQVTQSGSTFPLVLSK